MNNWMSVTLAIAALGIPVDIYAAPIPPAPDNPMHAQTSLGYSLKSRCPDHRITDEGTKAVVVFWLPRGGMQSQVSIKTSSGSNELDAAAISCVSKLRFAAATRSGDGESIDSWQQIALRWAERASPPAAASPAPIPVSARQDEPGVQSNSVTVHVCVDETGKLEREPAIVQSSGVAAVDQAAVKIAAAGSAYYRPQNSSSKPPVSGCVQLAIKFDTK
jgi:TonB family protein